ncbi:MAG TPA: VanZ family protein [Mucilaginibacter sp.]|jgi:VanZ family protein
MKTSFKYYRPAILWALFIFMLCSVKLGRISQSPIFFPGFDKLVHCGLFFMLVVLYCYDFIRQQYHQAFSYKKIILITIIAIVYGGVIELLQKFIFTWRSGEWGDLFADSAGACMGAFSIIITVKALRYAKE